MAKELPLWHRLYFSPVHTEIARLVGYAGKNFEDMKKEAVTLGEQYGKEKVQAAADELLDFEHDGKFVRLKSHVRPLCWGLLGAPPEHPWHELMKRPEPLPNSWDKPQAAPKAEPKKRTRKKNSP